MAQICSTVYQKLIGNRDEAVCKPSHPHHPSTLWSGLCQENMEYTLLLGMELCKEYSVRYKKEHGSLQILNYIKRNSPELPSGGEALMDFGAYRITPPALAMPDKYKSKDPVKSYRDYYINEKTHRKDGKTMMIYTRRDPPNWLSDKFVFEKIDEKSIMKERK